MTTVALRDGIMAADSALWQNDLWVGSVRKISRLPKGRLVGTAGNMGACQRLVALLRGNPSPDREAIEACGTGCSAIVADHDGTVWSVETDGGGMFELEAEFYAVGTGCELAIGRMDGGASAEQAIETAVKFDGGTRGPIQVETVQAPEPRKRAVKAQM